MKKILNIIFVTLGVIFFILILVGTYFFIADPLNLKPILFGTDSKVMMEETVDATVQVDKHPMLNEAQEKTLETFGIDPSEIPSEVSSEQEQCFDDVLGEERVEEIKTGDIPTVTEFFKVRECI